MKNQLCFVSAFLFGCQSVWGSLSIPNPENCVSSPSQCLADEVCDPQDQICHPALAMYAVSPSLSLTVGGGSVRILGERFLPNVKVGWQGQPVADVQYVSPIELSFTLPAAQAGDWYTPITLTNPTGQAVTRSDLFSYYSDEVRFSLNQYNEPRSARNIASGDFNSDGKMDLAVIANSSTEIAICLGNGDGTIRSPTFVASGGARDLLTLDVDGNGNLDLIVSGSGTVRTYFGNGKGGFTVGPSIPTGSLPEQLVWTKLSVGPERTLLVSDSVDKTLSLLTIHSDGTYTNRQTISTGVQMSEVAACDTSGDGIDELYFVDRVDGLHVAKANGSTDYSVGVVPLSGCVALGLTCRDLNQDGRMDLLLACQNGLLPIYGQAGGMLTGAMLESGSALSTHVMAEDLNGDGWPDLVFGDQTQKATLVKLSDRRGGYLLPSVLQYEAVGMGANSVLYRVADMDRDHKPDVLLGYPFAGMTTSVAIAMNRSR